uniref:3'-5' exonuclease domain-containing protein n=1 Tax=Alexandrium monilatum TaxID=311494 RepID=A0A7S4QV86_9DINO
MAPAGDETTAALDSEASAHAAPDAEDGGLMDSSVFEHQVVRDLHWAMASPHLLRPGVGLPLFEDARGRHLVAASGEWLKALDADPQPLRSFLQACPQHHRLGHYFAGLIEFWLRRCPALQTQKVLARKEVAATEADQADRAGKLKFLVRTKEDALHVEAAIHWSLARGLQEVDIVAARYSGAFLHESLCWRVLEARNRVRLASEPVVAESLKETLGAAPQSLCLLRGHVFYSVRWLRGLQRSAAQGSAKLQLDPGIMDGWRFLSPDHRVGWWTYDVRELLTPDRSESRWVLLEHKRFWLSPAVGMEDDDGRVRLHGDAVIRLRPLEATGSAEFEARVQSCRHLRAGHPVLVAELHRSSRNPWRWHEASRGFLLPEGWVMDAPSGDSGGISEQSSVSALEDSGSITQLQRSLECLLRAGTGLDAWWKEVDRLAEAAERIERRSVAAQEARLVELWQPPPASRPLAADGEHCDVVQALEARWPEASGDETQMAELRCAVLSHLAGSLSPAAEVVRALAELGDSANQRVLGHLLLDAFQKLSQKRGGVLSDRPLQVEVQAAWDSAVEDARAERGRLCPKLVAKASRALSLRPLPAPRQAILRDLRGKLSAFGFPGDAIPSTQREAQLTGAVQLCAVRLQAGGLQLLSEAEARPLLEWLVVAGEPSAAIALAKDELCCWTGVQAELRMLFGAHGLAKRRRQAPPQVGALPASSVSEDVELPLLRLGDDVTVRWVDSGMAAVEEELFAAAAAEGSVIALDAEWRPFRRGQAATPVELLQLAVPSSCWLLDLRQLVSREAASVAGFLRRLGSGECIVVGYGLCGDFQRIFESYEALPRVPVGRAADLSDDDRGGLSGMVRAALGHELDKAQQCSDWSQRPLSREQQAYAALDAHALLRLAARCAADTPSTELAAALRARSWDAVGPLALPLGPADVDAAMAALGVPSRSVGDDGGLEDVVLCKTLALVWSLPPSAVAAADAGPTAAATRRAVAVLSIEAQLSLPLAAAALGVPSSRLRLAKHQELIPIFGFEAGALGPVGLRPPSCPVLLDSALAEEEELAVGGGRIKRELRVPRGALCQALGAQVVPISRAAPQA